MTQFNPPTFSQPIQSVVPQRTSPLAITGLILGIFGFCSGGLFGLVGLILGIVAIVSINKSQGRIGGSGLAIAAIVVSSFTMIIGCAILPGLLLPAVAKARHNAQAIKSRAMLNQLNNALLAYANDHQDRLPPTDDWLNALTTITANAPELADSVTDRSPGRAYAMNRHLEGMRLAAIDDPAHTVLLFEVGPGSPLSGGQELIPASPRFSQGYLVLFADGTADYVLPGDMNKLVWSP